MIKKLSINEVEFLAHTLAQKFLAWDEPIPAFSTRFENKLESCLETPFITYGGTTLYRGLVNKAAILFYLLVKNHPFQNGNKRIAVTTLLLFLMKNKKWIKVGTQEFYNFAVWVAQSPPELKEDTVKAVASFIRQNMTEATASR
ncbi:type II toxin-antitoxin system death-on-curing family toxin [Patescibacteria group bacterium]|nr:type II toxin-antitoxin system death-on-curing family toxin [Patescibacteria group bacterium]MBU1016108.1 type II toxin-antitoxin system death-on-curing family toxin [Patescibacteria group bacterium]MBU1684851.1 type II toxin-antitoxin system death-on-curing family toxin [Patescibacteria group bacterium]MBU1938567.1 type II toxin-antitoxin system death-on-curing family toxin [Patescibacteria group bacterium]